MADVGKGDRTIAEGMVDMAVLEAVRERLELPGVVHDQGRNLTETFEPSSLKDLRKSQPPLSQT